MKLRALLLGAFSLSTLAASAQNWVYDSVAMGPGYANDIYYSLRNGIVKTQANTDWHLGFQMTPPGPYGNVSAIANHVQGGVKVYSLHLQASTKFSTLTAADTAGRTGTPLYNSDTSWNYGAFNQMGNPQNLLDYSWGVYDMNTHNVTGDSLYLIKVGTSGAAYKVWIQQYISNPADSIRWTFRIAQFDGTGDTTINMRRNTNSFATRLFGYYNVLTRMQADREPDRATWDMVATRYVDTASQGSVAIPYNTTGWLSNSGVTVADVRGIPNGDTAHYQNYARRTAINTIGYDWKTFDMSVPPGTWHTDSTINYFIKPVSSTNEYYQLQFTRFDGSITGKMVFRKRLFTAVSVQGVAAQAVTAWHVSPNPASSAVNVMVDAKDAAADAKLLVMDAAGKVVSQTAAPIQKGLNAYGFSAASLPNGLYFIRLGNGAWSVTQRIVVAH